MKRALTISAIVLLVTAFALPGVARAQDNAWHQKDMVLSAGVGFGMYGLYGSSTLPPIFVAFETGVAEKITLGGLVAYSGSSDDFGYGKWKYTYIVIAARGAYHFLEHQPKFDAYAGAGLGYDIVSASVTWNVPGYEQTFGRFYSASASYFFFDVFLGGRYYFSPKWALMGEVGYGVGFARIGVSYKLN
jgi:hypothetical protein